MSNLTKALAVVSLLTPVSAQPLGIGEIELHSTLNQNLNAEIRLSVAAGENPADVSVKLAPPEKFDQAGVVWNYFLSKIKLEPVIQANGSIIVKVSSREALTEPFLDFLLEVSWPQGSMVREFTLLIDPPTAYNQPIIPVTETSRYSAEPIEQLERPVRKSRPVPKRAVRAAPADGITPQTPTSGEFGPVQKSDTLWGIATQLGQEKNIPTQRMINALYKANPGAFSNGNMNALKEGVTLKIPESDAILHPSSKQARNEQKVERKPAKPETSQTEATSKPLELVAPTESKIAANAVITGQTKSEPATAPTTGAAADGTANQAGDGKDLEMQARIEKLEQQLGMMQQLLALKDQQLASLQGKQAQTTAPTEPNQLAPQAPVVAEQPAPPPATTAQPPASEAVVTPLPAPTPQPAPQPAPTPRVAPTPAPVVAQDEGLFSSDSYYLISGGLGAGILGVLGWLLWRKRKIDERTNTESMFASASQIRLPDSESSLSVPIMDINNPDEYDVGTVGESSFISDFTPSDFDAFDTDQNEVDPISEADVYLAYGRYQQAEELIRHAIAEQPNRDECKLKLLEIFYASENKDGFSSYAQELADAGKQTDKPFWKKITDMAKEIIPDSPLFGGGSATPVHTGKVDTATSSVLAATAAPKTAELEDDDFARLDDDLFDLNLDMAQDSALDDGGLDFDLGDFGGSSKQQEQTKQAETKLESIDFNQQISFEEPIELSGVAPSSADTPDSAIESFDFNFDIDTTSSVSEDQTQTDIPSQPELETFDFSDFDSIKAEPAPDSEKPVTAGINAPADIESFDFNFDTEATAPTLAKEQQNDSALNLESELKLETFDFSDFDSLTSNTTKTTDKSLSAGEANDEFNFNFDFDTPVISASSENTLDLGVSDLTDMDEFETKIDLAKAYIDMGDTEAARSIAEDVLAKGSKQQQQAAQALLDELK
ncbi:FimV/HubP family polar landmark protein [Methylomonas montana]|uniref:FimV/HubP family polar landmark protein n=1 Tax=Methylomonas montana TaxID=3058963 RepID=UPI00265A688F|nr:FimV/HubP family polar landmark protein [Methylomonas montana]WKJ89844.1 FimV/HubP family polar landmark protein [Methylomonas montana]